MRHKIFISVLVMLCIVGMLSQISASTILAESKTNFLREEILKFKQEAEKQELDKKKTDTKASSKNTTKSSNTTKTSKKASTNKNYTIVIDAGHQQKGNNEKEAIGPGATTKKAKVASGTQGVSTKVPEYKVTLQVALKLQDILEDKGYTVIMIRTTNDVNISNAERAKIANDANADAFIRLHCNGSETESVNGALTMCQTSKNPYCGSFYKDSRKLSETVLDGLCESTGAKKRSIIETDSMSGINWCQVPVTIVEMGFMTNVKEDKKLTEDSYQSKLAKGIANGIDQYFDSKK